MTVTEQQRHQLLAWFEERMDQERAATMMELLPPVGSDQLATKADVAALRADLRGDLAELRGDLAELRGDLQRTLGTWIFASQAAVITAMAVLLAALR